MSGLIGGLDLETTGFDATTGDRLVELALLTYDSDTESGVDALVHRINPERSIPAAASAVHKIMFEDVAKCQPFGYFASEVHFALAKLDLLVIHNADFDLPFLTAELNRVGSSMPSVPVICTMKNGRWATFDGKSPNLGELCFSLGIDYDKAAAHAATYDVLKMMACYFAGRKRGFYE